MTYRTIQWTCGHAEQEPAGDLPSVTIQRPRACVTCRNAELGRGAASAPVMSLQAHALDGDEHGLFHAPVYPIRSGTCGMCGRSLSTAGHPSDGVCDNV